MSGFCLLVITVSSHLRFPDRSPRVLHWKSQVTGFTYFYSVTSSEKVDKKDRYRDFTLISLPYPGCEFFKQYRDNGYNAEELMFEWNQGHVDANIFVPPDVSTDALNLEWSQYRVRYHSTGCRPYVSVSFLINIFVCRNGI